MDRGVRRDDGASLGLEPGGGLTISTDIDTRRNHVVGVTDSVGTVDVIVVSNDIVRAPDLIVDVVAKRRRVRVRRVAHLQADNARANELDPFDNLSVLLVVLEIAASSKLSERSRVLTETVGEDNTTERVTLLISTMRIEF